MPPLPPPEPGPFAQAVLGALATVPFAAIAAFAVVAASAPGCLSALF